MDFGLARLMGSKTLTQTGTSVGPPAYMSPEQVRGKDVDSRSDLFSLGVVLYEMVTGAQPFEGEHELAIMHSVLYNEPRSFKSHHVTVPESVQAVILKALEKEREAIAFLVMHQLV